MIGKLYDMLMTAKIKKHFLKKYKKALTAKIKSL